MGASNVNCGVVEPVDTLIEMLHVEPHVIFGAILNYRSFQPSIHLIEQRQGSRCSNAESEIIILKGDNSAGAQMARHPFENHEGIR